MAMLCDKRSLQIAQLLQGKPKQYSTWFEEGQQTVELVVTARGLGTSQLLCCSPFALCRISAFVCSFNTGEIWNTKWCVLLALHSDVLPSRSTLAMVGRAEKKMTVLKQAGRRLLEGRMHSATQ